ncbi:MAG TPA: GNAT family protein [Terracidiphilus sp.]|nr:GNAT family protein [Terracidiphilus sp.]
MNLKSVTLEGRHVRLEPLAPAHAEGLVAAAAGDAQLYQWSAVPMSRDAVNRYIETALALREAGSALAFATIRKTDAKVIGSTRYFDIESWPWPEKHARHGRGLPDVCEIGYTWLSPDAVRTAANTEAKFLMLQHGFETWGLLRICLHTDARNIRSQKAIERIGGIREGLLRAHRFATDFTPRDSVRYSILAKEWPGLKQRLTRLMHRS